MVDRVRVHRVIGLESEGVTLTQAQHFIDQARADARRERLSLPAGRKVALGFAAAANDYLQRLEAGPGRNLKQKRQHFAQHLVPFFGDKPLSKIVPFDLQRYSKQRRAAGASPATVNSEQATLSHLLHRAVEWSWLDRLVKIPRWPVDNRRLVYLTPDQIQRLLARRGWMPVGKSTRSS